MATDLISESNSNFVALAETMYIKSVIDSILGEIIYYLVWILFIFLMMLALKIYKENYHN